MRIKHLKRLLGCLSDIDNFEVCVELSEEVINKLSKREISHTLDNTSTFSVLDLKIKGNQMVLSILPFKGDDDKSFIDIIAERMHFECYKYYDDFRSKKFNLKAMERTIVESVLRAIGLL